MKNNTRKLNELLSESDRRFCPTCTRVRSKTDFTVRSNGQYVSECKDCAYDTDLRRKLGKLTLGELINRHRHYTAVGELVMDEIERKAGAE